MSAFWSDEARDAARARLPVVVAIEAPPCVRCFHWKPRAITNREGDFDGIRLCHGEMRNDFSCFYQKPASAP
jgi:hypothetical protein